MSDFTDIVGQEAMKEHLQSAVKTGQVSHAYIINGERSSGKRFIASIFAAALQCEGAHSQEGVPCGQCHSCKQAFSQNHPDIIRITHEKPNTISVDDIRQQVNADISIKPYSGPYKIYIIPEAEKMNTAAQNALLKTLEEPPAYAVILILTTNLNSMLPTILSRCVALNMKPVPDEQIMKYLMQEQHIPDYKASVCVAFARGNLGKAKELAASEEFEQIKGTTVTLLRNIHDMDISEMANAVKNMSEDKVNIKEYLDIMTVWYRDALLYKATNDANHLIFVDEIQYISKVATKSSYEGIENIIVMIAKTQDRLDANVNFDLTMQMLLLAVKEN